MNIVQNGNLQCIQKAEEYNFGDEKKKIKIKKNF